MDATRKPTVGFIGLGLMGEGMARRLMAAGHPMTALAHRRREAVDALLILPWFGGRGQAAMRSTAAGERYPSAEWRRWVL